MLLKVRTLLILLTLKEVEVAEVAIEVEVVEVEEVKYCAIGAIVLLDFLPKEQANHKVAQCPYQKQAKDSWWKNQFGNTQGETSAPQLENKEN